MLETSGLTTEDLRLAMERMSRDDMAFFLRLAKEGQPREAQVFLELHHYFPGTRIIDDSLLERP